MVTYWQTDKQKRGCLHEVSLKNQHQHSRMTTMIAKTSGSNLNDGEDEMASLAILAASSLKCARKALETKKLQSMKWCSIGHWRQLSGKYSCLLPCLPSVALDAKTMYCPYTDGLTFNV
jgi:hypothetical protein